MIRNLALGQRIGLGFLLIGLLVLLSSGLGLAFTSSVTRTIEATQTGLQQFDDLAQLERTWAKVSSIVDRMLLTRQTGGAIQDELQVALTEFDQQLTALSSQSSLSGPDQALAETLQLLGNQLMDLVNEITAVSRQGSWARAQVIRHTEMNSLQRRFDENLEQYRTNIQADIDTAVARSIQAQNYLRLIWIGTVVLAVVVGTGVGLWVMRSITQPVDTLIAQTRRVKERDFSEITPLNSQDEIGELSLAFAEMTNLLRESYEELEQRVADRTRALLTSTQVSRQLTTILDQDELIQEVVEQVNSAFEYYHTHVYLFDNNKQYLVMVSGTGEAGAKMLARGHKIETGKGLVGRAAVSGVPVLVSDVSQAEDWLPNPLLPETKSETAVPILIGQDVLGVLDVQHNVVNGLQQEDIDLLQSIANQLAIALRNSRFYQELNMQAKRATVINDINQKILSTTDMETAMKVAIREIGQLTGASWTSVRLRADGPANGRSLEVGGADE